MNRTETQQLLRHSLRLVFVLPLAAAAWILGPATAVAQPQNTGFDTPNASYASPNYPVSIAGLGVAGASSAANWNLWNNSAAITATELLPSSDPTGGGTMIRVTTGGAYNGLYQVFGSLAGGQYPASVDLLVVSGSVYFAAYRNGGSVIVSQRTTSPANNGQWQTIFLDAPANFDQFVVYSSASGGAEFFADNLKPIPEPASVSVLGFGALLLFAARRRLNR